MPKQVRHDKLEFMKNQSQLMSYITGFILSLLFTFSAYFIVVNHLASLWILIAIILTLAVLQLMVQLIFFLHLGHESKPHWNLTFFLSTFFFVLFIVISSIWIMTHLNYNMSAGRMDKFITHDEGIVKSSKY